MSRLESMLTQLLTTSAHPEEAGGRLEGVEGYECQPIASIWLNPTLSSISLLLCAT